MHPTDRRRTETEIEALCRSLPRQAPRGLRLRSCADDFDPERSDARLSSSSWPSPAGGFSLFHAYIDLQFEVAERAPRAVRSTW